MFLYVAFIARIQRNYEKDILKNNNTQNGQEQRMWIILNASEKRRIHYFLHE